MGRVYYLLAEMGFRRWKEYMKIDDPNRSDGVLLAKIQL